MSERHLIICDGCKRDMSDTPIVYHVTRGPNVGFLRIATFTYDFCSVRCLFTWIHENIERKQETAPEPVHPDPDEVDPDQEL